MAQTNSQSKRMRSKEQNKPRGYEKLKTKGTTLEEGEREERDRKKKTKRSWKRRSEVKTSKCG